MRKKIHVICVLYRGYLNCYKINLFVNKNGITAIKITLTNNFETNLEYKMNKFRMLNCRIDLVGEN